MKEAIQFEFTSKQKNLLFGFMGLGILCMIIIFFTDDALAPRFWSNFLLNSVFFTGISFIALFSIASMVTAYSGWQAVFKRVWEAYAQFLIVGLILMVIIIIGMFGGFHHLYHWADADSVAADEILQGKSSFLNKGLYTAVTIITLGVWYFFARKMRDLSIEEDQLAIGDFSAYRQIKKYSAAFLPIAAVTSAVVVWLWVMSLNAHWYSTLFAWYATSSWFVAMLSMTILTLIYLKSVGYFSKVSVEHFHDLGKFLFGFSIFWTYLWFSQYMLIWYGNVGEETIYFHDQRTNYPVLFYGNLVVNFVVPFFILLRNDTKRKVGTLVLTSAVVFIGHWMDFFLMIKPGVLHTYHEIMGHGGGGHAVLDNMAGQSAKLVADAGGHGAEAVSTFVNGFTFPGLLDVGVFLGFLAFFLYFVLVQLAKTRLEPVGDPYIGESIHHHVI